MLKTLYDPFYMEVERACKRIIGMSGDLVSVSMKNTEYVLSGYTVTITTKQGSQFPFWTGVNGPRLFFIAFVAAGHETAKDVFQFCFGGAEKVGWEVKYEKIETGTSIWATCMTNRDRPLINDALTEEGIFWATDIAMMVQSWVRSCERSNIKRHHMEPAPL